MSVYRVGAAIGAVLLLELPLFARAQDQGVFYPGIYYLQSPDREGALPLPLAPGEEGAGLLFELSPAGGEVRVRVVEEGSGEPIPGILVEAQVAGRSRFLRTEADGVALVTGVPAGRVRLRARPDDPRSETGAFAPRYAPGVIDPAQALALDLTDSSSVDFGDLPLPAAGRVKARVLHPTDGSPWPDVPVILRSVEGEPRILRRSDSEGRVSFGGLEPGGYLLWADTRGTDGISEAWDGSRDTLASTAIVVDRETLLRYDLAPDLGGRILGAVRDEFTQFGLPDLEVRVFPVDDAARYFTARTDALGFYEAAGLPSGSYKIYVPGIRRYYPDAERIEDARAVGIVEPEAAMGIDVRGTLIPECELAPPSAGVIEGSVNADFSILPRARIVAWSVSDTLETWIDVPGLYRIVCLPTGSYRVAIEPDGVYRTQYHPKTNDPALAELVEVAPGDTTRAIDFEPELGVSLSGTVVRELDGTAAEGISVRAFLEDPPLEIETTTDASGAFAFRRKNDGTGLPAGTWIVRTDSIAISAVALTPVLSVDLIVTGPPGARELVFSFPETDAIADWVLLGRGSDGAGRVIVDAARHPDGLRAHGYRDATPGILAYRLEVLLDRPGGGLLLDSGWREAPGEAREPEHVAPQPWDGRSILELPYPVRPGTQVDLFGVGGERLARAIAGPDGATLDPSLAKDLPGGVYLLRWRDLEGRLRRGRLVLAR